MKMDNLDSPKRIEQYDALVEKSKVLKSTFQTMQGQYGLDLATGMLNPSFEGTKQLKKFNVKFDHADLMMDMRSPVCVAQFDLEDWI